MEFWAACSISKIRVVANRGCVKTSRNCSKLQVRSWNSGYSLYQRTNPLVFKLFPVSKLRRLSQEPGGRDSGW